MIRSDCKALRERVRLRFAASLGAQRLVLGFLFFGNRGDADRRARRRLSCRIFGKLPKLTRLFGGRLQVAPAAAATRFAFLSHYLGEHAVAFVFYVENSDAHRITGVVARVFDLHDAAVHDRGGRRWDSANGPLRVRHRVRRPREACARDPPSCRRSFRCAPFRDAASDRRVRGWDGRSSARVVGTRPRTRNPSARQRSARRERARRRRR